MTQGSSHANKPLQLDASHEHDRLIVLTPDDEDRFVRRCGWVVEAAKLGISRDLWLRELHSLLTHVRRWAEQHAQRIRRCLATQRDAQIAILVEPDSNHFDFTLSDLLTELDLELAEKFQACACDVLQVPHRPLEELHELAGKGEMILIYGDG